ncbi:MAG: TlpA disulfide reductase family protein [Gammaproteobacteria bacterium]
MKSHHARYLILMLISLLSPLTARGGEIERFDKPLELNFSLPDLNGELHVLPDYHGKVVLVNFWASWCPPCIYEMPELMRLRKQFADKPFEILAINVAEKKYRVRKFTKVIDLTLPVLLDTNDKAFSDWGVKTLPTSFLVDAHSKVRYRIRGNPGWEHEDTVAIIEKLIAETAASTTSNRSINNGVNR